jgi:hypothetical protein
MLAHVRKNKYLCTFAQLELRYENENEDENVPSSARLSTYGAQENEDETRARLATITFKL